MSGPPSGGTSARDIPFGEYAAVYDLIYQDKDYIAESLYVADLVERYAPAKGRTARVVDLACGTGRHAFELAGLGYAMDCSDISADMVDVARRGAAERRLSIRFHNQSFQTAGSIGGNFDAALAMFAAFGYLTEWGDVARTLRNVAKLLAPGGIFIFDVWNGASVLRDYSPHKVRQVSDEKRSVERVSCTTLDIMRQVARVQFDFTVTPAQGPMTRFEEVHYMRFYFPRELSDLLQAMGFRIVSRCPFMSPDRELQPEDWNMTYVVQVDA